MAYLCRLAPSTASPFGFFVARVAACTNGHSFRSNRTASTSFAG